MAPDEARARSIDLNDSQKPCILNGRVFFAGELDFWQRDCKLQSTADHFKFAVILILIAIPDAAACSLATPMYMSARASNSWSMYVASVALHITTGDLCPKTD